MSLRDVGDVCICMFIYILMRGYIYSQGLIAFRDVVLLSTASRARRLQNAIRLLASQVRFTTFVFAYFFVGEERWQRAILLLASFSLRPSLLASQVRFTSYFFCTVNSFWFHLFCFNHMMFSFFPEKKLCSEYKIN